MLDRISWPLILVENGFWSSFDFGRQKWSTSDNGRQSVTSHVQNLLLLEMVNILVDAKLQIADLGRHKTAGAGFW